MKILHIITDTNIGGAGKLLVAVLKNADYGKFDIAVALPSGSALIPLVEATKAKVITTEHGRDKSFENAAVRELCRIIKTEKPDVVHTHASLSGRIAAKICGVKIRIMTRHCVFGNKASATRFPKKQLRALAENALTTHYVATAEVAKRELIEVGCDEKKITVIQNGSEPVRELSAAEKAAQRAALGIPNDAFVVGISARLEDYKGHKYLFEAATMTGKDDIYYLVVGDGSIADELHSLAEKFGIAKNVIFTGFVSDMAPYYGIMDVGANCSFGTETTPLAITEAMSVGVPSIVSDYGGNAATVTDGVDGKVIPMRDSKALADAVLSLYNDREKLAVLGENARRSHAEKYSAKKMTEKLEKLYLSLE